MPPTLRKRPIPKPKPKPRTTKKPRRTHYKKQLVKPKSIQEVSNISCSNKIEDGSDICDHQGLDTPTTTSACSTPKAERFRIPEINTCPPAPRKRRVLSNCSNFQRTPIAFFAPPDLELFFFVALRDISV